MKKSQVLLFFHWWCQLAINLCDCSESLITHGTFYILEEKNIVTLTKRSGKELKVSASYKKMIEGALDVAAKEFLKQKIESANWFKNAILQREETLLNVMNAIVNFQEKYFLSGED